MPQDAYDLYQWHDGLFSTPSTLNPIEKLLRLKDKWHGELSGRENEIHLRFNRRPLVAKFLPLDYALSGHRHLKLGRCPIDLLPVAIVRDANQTIYCMMRLDPQQPIIYCANGTQLPPIKVTESFLATQRQFDRLTDFIVALDAMLPPNMSLSSGDLERIDDLDLTIDSTQFAFQFLKPN